MQRFILALIVLAFAVGVLPAHAESGAMDYYRIAGVQVKEVVPTPEEIYSDYLIPVSPQPIPNMEGLEFDWNAMVLIGQKLIQIIQAGKPVVSIQRDVVSVVPHGVNAWEQLAGWQAPMTKVYSVQVMNRLGVNVIDLRVKVSAMWGGNLNGRGRYLSNVLVVPNSVNVSWGFNLDLWTEHREPVNSGSVDNPVAGLGFDIRYKATSWLAEQQGTQDYFLTGDGKIEAL